MFSMFKPAAETGAVMLFSRPSAFLWITQIFALPEIAISTLGRLTEFLMLPFSM